FYVKGTGGTPPILQIGTDLTTVNIGAILGGSEIPIGFGSWVNVAAAGGGYLTTADAADRAVINGRAWATRLRAQGSIMVRQQSTATSGAITLDHNAYGHFLTSPAGNITYTFSDGGADPTSGAYASEFTLEIFNPGANTITWPGTVV
ncbi:hypothetical protein, partial [Salmonella enterica]|uniref:hypothetical protein n=1 Tax=Salmonella enterica TaxID=28901 RepID=UPI003525342F